MTLTVGFSVILTINEFAPDDTAQATPLSPPIPFDAPPTVAVDTSGVVTTTVLADGTIQVDSLVPGAATVTATVLIGGQSFSASLVITDVAVIPPPPVVGSIGLSAGTPFPTPVAGSAAVAHPGTGFSARLRP
jgi:hypothetical protein